MENNNNKLLQALRNSGSDKILEAYKWVQEHRSELRKEVYGPVLLEVHPSSFRLDLTYLIACLFSSVLTNLDSLVVCSQVNVPDLLHASYLERHVPNYIWKVL